ncbi:MAG: hypothetical protein ACXWEJ_08370 [Actinomycetota bacterium]
MARVVRACRLLDPRHALQEVGVEGAAGLSCIVITSTICVNSSTDWVVGAFQHLEDPLEAPSQEISSRVPVSSSKTVASTN